LKLKERGNPLFLIGYASIKGMILIALVLAWFGLCLGSFAGAVVWRIHKGKDWVRGRSQCQACGHELAAADLVPLFSYLALRGRCRYCKKPIPRDIFYIEVAGGLIFALSYLLWPQPLHHGQVVLLGTWLACSVGLLALFVYDLRWMLLPTGIVYVTAAIAAVGRAIYIIGYEPDKMEAALLWLGSLGIAAGLFWLMYQVSDRLIGGGDIRLGLITGTLLGVPAKSFLMIFLASIIGTVFMLPGLLRGKKGMSSQLPFGPFLIVATAIVLFWGQSFIDWYLNLTIG
jgi:prepilin signal peptidase PulO-like enzyme (type II secretory pathway)